jgi:small subunit ribosomal protein S3
MGQKVHPKLLRLGPSLGNGWHTVGYAKSKDYASFIAADLKVRRMIKAKYEAAQVGNILSEFSKTKAVLNIHCKKPGVIVGSGGSEITLLKNAIADLTNMEDVVINVHEIRYADLDAILVAKSIASQLERRVSFRKAMKKSIQSSMRQGAQGIKISCAGRLGGAEIARVEKYMEGKIPLHTLKADVDYAPAVANTSYGVIGVKVWIYREKKISHWSQR